MTIGPPGPIGPAGPPGQQGVQGPKGATGPRGSNWTFGHGPPTDTTDALVNDMYLDIDTTEVYAFGAEGWVRAKRK